MKKEKTNMLVQPRFVSAAAAAAAAAAARARLSNKRKCPLKHFIFSEALYFYFRTL